MVVVGYFQWQRMGSWLFCLTESEKTMRVISALLLVVAVAAAAVSVASVQQPLLSAREQAVRDRAAAMLIGAFVADAAR